MNTATYNNETQTQQEIGNVNTVTVE